MIRFNPWVRRSQKKETTTQAPTWKSHEQKGVTKSWTQLVTITLTFCVFSGSVGRSVCSAFYDILCPWGFQAKIQGRLPFPSPFISGRVQQFYMLVLDLAIWPFPIFLLSFKSIFLFDEYSFPLNHCPLCKSIWFPRMPMSLDFRVGFITDVTDLGWVSFSELYTQHCHLTHIRCEYIAPEVVFSACCFLENRLR